MDYDWALEHDQEEQHKVGGDVSRRPSGRRLAGARHWRTLIRFTLSHTEVVCLLHCFCFHLEYLTMTDCVAFRKFAHTSAQLGRSVTHGAPRHSCWLFRNGSASLLRRFYVVVPSECTRCPCAWILCRFRGRFVSRCRGRRRPGRGPILSLTPAAAVGWANAVNSVMHGRYLCPRLRRRVRPLSSVQTLSHIKLLYGMVSSTTPEIGLGVGL